MIMWYEFLLEGLKKFSGEIIGLILLAVFWRMFPGLRNWFKKLKKDDADDVDVRQALEKIQRQLEARPENVNPVDPLTLRSLTKKPNAEQRLRGSLKQRGARRSGYRQRFGGRTRL